MIVVVDHHFGRQIPVVVISLPRASERRAQCAARLSKIGVDFTFFDAVDGQQLSEMAVAQLHPRPHLRDYGRPLGRGEIGCAVSHIEVIDRIAAGTDPYVCVLEDDADPAPFLRHLLDPRTLIGLTEFDLLRLVVQTKRLHRSLVMPTGEIDGHQIVAPVHRGYLMVGQIISRAGARQMARRFTPLFAPIDNMIYRDARIALKVLEVRPGAVLHHDARSQLGPERGNLARQHRAARSFSQWIARTAFVARAYLQDWLNFARSWGWQSLFSLRRP
jgi:glycosyl transferase family 25